MLIDPSALRVAMALEATSVTAMTPLVSMVAKAVAEAMAVAPEVWMVTMVPSGMVIMVAPSFL